MKNKPGRPSPYGVAWKVDGKERTMFFANAANRDAKMAELLRAAKRGDIMIQPTRDELKDWAAFRQAIGDTPWQDVVAGWRAHLSANPYASKARLVQVAADDYLMDLKKRVAEKNYAPATYAHVKTIIRRFADAFGAMSMDKVTDAEIVSWIEDDLGFDNPRTFNSYRRSVCALYNYCGDEVLRNPVKKIRIRARQTEVVGLITVAETAKLFAYAYAHHKEALGRLGLEAFAGLRFSSAYRIEKNEINFADRGLLLPGSKLKTKKRRYVDGLPENLWPWLEATNDGCWAMTNSDWMHLKSKLFHDAAVPHPNNCMRHSFGTHHVAGYKNPGLTATILCHTNQRELWDHYNGLATQQAGKAYFSITPQTAAAMAADPAVQALTYPGRQLVPAQPGA